MISFSGALSSIRMRPLKESFFNDLNFKYIRKDVIIAPAGARRCIFRLPGYYMQMNEMADMPGISDRTRGMLREIRQSRGLI